jgi:murein DD-endopeptidase MepM/ murein hydrolase activator NlpD
MLTNKMGFLNIMEFLNERDENYAPMNESNKTPFRMPLRTSFLILLSLACAYYFYLHRDLQQKKAPIQASFIITPAVPELTESKVIAAPLEPVAKSVVISKNETFSELMQSQGFDNSTINEVYKSAKDVYNLAQIRAGNNIEITSNPANEFVQLEYAIDPSQSLIVARKDGVIKAEKNQHPTEFRTLQLGGYIDGSLYYTINQLGEDDQLVIDFAGIFDWDVDFFKDLQVGDSFRIIYERQYINGQPYGYGKILAAELTNKGRTLTAIGYQQGKDWEFFSPDGKAMKKAFLASPIKFSRISSGFTTRRYHPVLKTYRPHYGIDYAAPYGTPVRAIGKGKVILAGWAGGAGKAIKIQHDKSIATTYCHLSRFAAGIRQGASVSQGQVIGYVGATGLATGPHLDFRYLINGKYVNFLAIKKPQAEPLSIGEIARFKSSSGQIVDQLQGIALVDPSQATAYVPPSSIELSEGTL